MVAHCPSDSWAWGIAVQMTIPLDGADGTDTGGSRTGDEVGGVEGTETGDETGEIVDGGDGVPGRHVGPEPPHLFGKNRLTSLVIASSSLAANF